jgi:hypothetical protein
MKITSRALEMAEEIAMWEVARVALSHFPPRQYVVQKTGADLHHQANVNSQHTY